jgi:hypothetical protein
MTEQERVILERCCINYENDTLEKEIAIRVIAEMRKQFNEYLEKKKERELNKKDRYSTSVSEENYYGYRAALIAEIINELFGEEKK